METPTAPSLVPESRSRVLINVGAVIGITVFALIFRLIYLFQIKSVPLFSNLISDSLAYDQWAHRIANGDLLGEGVFYQAPLYPYFLGLLHYMVGHDLWSIRVVQIVFGAVSCGLLYLAGRFFFSPAIGIASGLILSLYAPAIFYDGLIQKSVLDLFLVVLLLVVLGISLEKPHGVKWTVAGVIVGLLGLTRENALLWFPVIVLWLCVYFSSFKLATRIRWSALIFAGLCLVLLPVGLRNLKAGGQFVLTTAQMGPNFYIGNNRNANGLYAPLRPGRADPQFERADAQELAEKAVGHRLTATQVSHYWLGLGLDYIWAQPLNWVALLGRKWMITWNFLEIEDSDDSYIYQQWSPLLRMMAVLGNFGILAPLAAVGILLTLEERRRLAVLYLLTVTLAVSVAFFYVFGRYRFPLVPMLALFAGAGVVRVCAVAKAMQLRWLCGSLVTGVLAWFMVNWVVVGKPGPTVAGYNNLARVLSKTGRAEEAIANYRQALQLAPQSAEAHYNLGSLLGMRGNLEEAKQHLELAVKFEPDYAEAHSNLGNVLSMQGNPKGAVEQYRKALEVDPTFDDTRYNLGMALLFLKEFRAAAEQFELILKKRPDFAQAHFLLGNAFAAGGRLSDAMGEFRETIRLKPDFAEGYVGLARALAMSGRIDEARQHYERALALLKSQQQAEKKGK
jgi:tetratricopeptide (TPR) repeat protein